MSEPRPGYRMTVTSELVDPEGFRMNDVTANWYGFDRPVDNLVYDAIQSDVVEAVNNVARRYAVHKAERENVNPEIIKELIEG